MNYPKYIFLIPYRDREAQKNHFMVYMKYILEDYDINDYEIYFCHQNDNRPFNRGAIKNIGFLAMKKKYPNDYKNINFIFNDIDTIPAKKNMINFETQLNIIKHFYGFRFTLGGIFSIKGSDFEKIKGFPNFWSWGFEDKCINNRALENKIYIDRKNMYEIGNQNIIHIMDNPNKIISKKDCWRIDENSDNIDNINNLDYYIFDEIYTNFYIININFFTCMYDLNNEILYTQNIALKKGIKKDISFSNEYNSKKNYTINNIKKNNNFSYFKLI